MNFEKQSLAKTIEIDGKEVTFMASAVIPRIYHATFCRDFYEDLGDLEKRMSKNKKGKSPFDIPSLERFENIAYIMAKQADPTLPDTSDEWLDEFSAFSIYQVLPNILELWKGMNSK